LGTGGFLSFFRPGFFGRKTPSNSLKSFVLLASDENSVFFAVFSSRPDHFIVGEI
jgi:hypothetical protein